LLSSTIQLVPLDTVLPIDQPVGNKYSNCVIFPQQKSVERPEVLQATLLKLSGIFCTVHLGIVTLAIPKSKYLQLLGPSLGPLRNLEKVRDFLMI
jgi:hypothetical protein